MSVRDEYEKIQADRNAAQELTNKLSLEADRKASERADRLFDALEPDKDFFAKHNYVIHKKSPQVVLVCSEDEIVCTCFSEGISIDVIKTTEDGMRLRSVGNSVGVKSVPEAIKAIAQILASDRSSDMFMEEL